MSQDLAAETSQFLLDLARGKYDPELAAADSALNAIGAAEPWALVVKRIVDSFVAMNKMTAPQAVVPDGKGGIVPSTNSHVGPDGNFRPDHRGI